MSKLKDYFKNVPPLWTPKPPRRRYKHHVSVVSNLDEDVSYTLIFTSKEKASAFKKAAGEAENNVTVVYEQRVISNEEVLE